MVAPRSPWPDTAPARADHDVGPRASTRDAPEPVPIADRVGDLADRLGVGVGTVVGIGVAAGAVLLAVALWWARPEPPPPELTIPWASTTTPPAPAAPTSSVVTDLLVHAAGAVARPGVHRLDAGARVADLLTAAGGPIGEADLDRLNLAAPLADGDRVYVPTRGETEVPTVLGPTGPPGGGGPGVGGVDAAPGGPVDVNRASAAELERLPGVGPVTAAAIIEHREAHGPFAAVEDLLAVRGIGEAKLAGLADRVTVGRAGRGRSRRRRG